MTTPTTRRQEMPKAYDPSQVEARLYAMWEEGGAFKPRPGGEPFCIIMPPPNVTGELHMGHALTAAVEDILTRWHRMLGDTTLWLPGVDHAGIATQNVVERELAKDGLSRHDVGRERFVERVWEWVRNYRHVITDQHKRLGASCDWERECFTLDPGPARAVRTTFKNLYDEGLIYRGERIINWCPRCQTALSELEVEHGEEQGNLWYVRYPLVDDAGRDAGGAIEIATTRPETIPADVAVAVHPEDEQYRALLGRRARVPLGGRLVPIIADEAIELGFGTGALKVTPGHDVTDFEIGERHGLQAISVIDFEGRMTAESGAYAGMDRDEARWASVRDLEAGGFLVKTEVRPHAVGHCQRCHTVIEPLISEQWFVRIAPMAEPALAAVRDGRIRFVPERFARTYEHWMENIKDWCISRQLWWGHRIPVWYCEQRHQTVEVEDPARCGVCGSTRITQDGDVLDTWFSSGLWPHSTLGWPEQTDELRTFYPSTVMETGYDIIFFWVARMIMFGMHNMGDVPFRTVYLHGLVRDESGQKMSKSRGNVVNPLDTIDQYGSDALRFALVTNSSPGNDQRLSDQKLEAARNFANKLWNAARFVITSIQPDDPRDLGDVADRPAEDRWILSRLSRLEATVDSLMREFQLGEAGRQIHEFAWGEYCDWYIEMAKVRLRAGDRSPVPALLAVLEQSLRLLHPFAPFVTEEIWQSLREELPGAPAEMLITADYPQGEPSLVDDAVEAEMAAVIEAVRSIRNIRAERGVDAGRWIEAHVAPSPSLRGLFEASAEAIATLARVRPLAIAASPDDLPSAQVHTAVIDGATIAVPLAGLFDVVAERDRLAKQIAEAERELASVVAKLDNPQFRERAPADLVAREDERRQSLDARLEGLRARLGEMEG